MSLQQTVNFDNPQNFNFESGKIDFSGGKIWDGNYRTNRIFAAKFREDLNGRDSGNNIVNSTTSGNVSITYNRTFLADYDINKIDFAAADIGLGNLALKGTIRAVIMPNYSENPTYPQIFWSNCKDGDLKNYLSFYHWNNGILFVSIFDNTGTKQIELSTAWSPVQNKEYEFELCWDLTQASVILFKDGVPFLTYSGAPIERDSDIDCFRIGTGYEGTDRSNFYVRDVAIFSEVQHTSSFTPDDRDAEYFELTGARLNKTADYSFLVNFKNHDTNELDADFAEGEKIGTGYNNPQVVNGELDLTHNDVRYIDYPYTGNIDGLTQSAIRIGIKPNYSGSPGSTQMFFFIGDNTGNGSIYCHQLSSGLLYVTMKSVDGANSYYNTIDWGPTQGGKYHFEVNWNISKRKFWFYINGQKQFERTLPDSFFRALQGSFIRIGANPAATYTSNFFILYFSISKSILHDSSITSFDDYDKTSEMAYPVQESHYIEPKTKILTDGLEGVDGTVTDTDDGDRRYIVVRENDLLYWDGSQWTESDGTWSQANDPATAIANLSSLDLTDGYNCTFRVMLRSEEGKDTDEIQSIIIDYNFYGGDATELNVCTVYGYLYDFNNNPLANANIYIKLIDDATEGKKIFPDNYTLKTTTNSNGYFEINIIPNSLISPTSGYQFEIQKYNFYKKYCKIVPNSTSVNFNNLTDYS